MTAIKDFINAQRLDIKDSTHLKHWAALVWFGGGKPITLDDSTVYKVPTLIKELMETVETYQLAKTPVTENEDADESDNDTNKGEDAPGRILGGDDAAKPTLEGLKAKLEQVRVDYLKADPWYKPRNPTLSTYYKTPFVAAAPTPAATQTSSQNDGYRTPPEESPQTTTTTDTAQAPQTTTTTDTAQAPQGAPEGPKTPPPSSSDKPA